MITWTEVGPFGHQAQLPAGLIATVYKLGLGEWGWSLVHPDLPRRSARGQAATMALAKQAMAAAAKAFAESLADALDARAALISSRAAAARSWVAP